MRYAFSYSPWMQPLLAVLACGPRFSSVVVGDQAVTVRMGWAFRARVPRHTITAAPWPPEQRRPLSRGAHGWKGRWLVNGSAEGLVTLTIDPPTTAKVLGLNVALRELTVSVTDPAALVGEFQTRPE